MRPGAGTGRRHRAARSALWQPDLADCGHSEVSPGAPAPQACRLRDGVPGRVGRTRISYAIRLAPIMDATALRAARPHSPAGGRGDGRRASGAGIGRRASGCGKSAQWGAPARSTTPSPAHHGCGALRPPRIPSATPAVAATDSGRLARGRAGGTGRAKHVLPPNTGSRKHPPAHLRHGRAGCAKWALADVLGFTACEYRTPSIGRPRADHGRSAPTPIAHPHPHAGGRGDGARAARSALCNPTPAAGGYRPAQPRHGRAGCARHRGEVAAHRLSWTQCPPPAAHPHPRAGGRGDGQRRGGPERADGTSRSLLRRAGTRV